MLSPADDEAGVAGFPLFLASRTWMWSPVSGSVGKSNLYGSFGGSRTPVRGRGGLAGPPRWAGAAEARSAVQPPEAPPVASPGAREPPARKASP